MAGRSLLGALVVMAAAAASVSHALATSTGGEGQVLVFSGALVPGAPAERRQLFTIRSDGTARHRVTAVNGGALLPSPIRGTSRIVYQRGGNSSPGFYTVGIAGGGNARLPIWCRGECLEQVHPAVSPDGKRLAYVIVNGPVDASGNADHVDLVVSNLDGRERRVLYSATYAGDKREPDAPAWSRDGSTIAFQENHRDGHSTLAVIRAGGSGYRVLSGASNGLSSVANPSWSPGGMIAFDGCTDSDHCEIFTIRPNGSGRRRLTRGLLSLDPDWSPDGSRIAFVRWDPEWNDLDLWIMDADGSGQERVFRARTLESAPAWIR